MTEKEAIAELRLRGKVKEFTWGQSEAGNCVSADSSKPKTVKGQREQDEERGRGERRRQHGVRGR